MRLEDLQARLRRAHAELGFRGRFSVTFHQELGAFCAIQHWMEIDGQEDCREIGSGSLDDCLASLDRYVAGERKTAP